MNLIFNSLMHLENVTITLCATFFHNIQYRTIELINGYIFKYICNLFISHHLSPTFPDIAMQPAGPPVTVFS